MMTENWSKIYTAQEAEADLPGFKFKGPGWYLTKTDTVLVIAHERIENFHYKESDHPNEKFTFYVWNDSGTRSQLQRLLEAVVRVDER